MKRVLTAAVVALALTAGGARAGECSYGFGIGFGISFSCNKTNNNSGPYGGGYQQQPPPPPCFLMPAGPPMLMIPASPACAYPGYGGQGMGPMMSPASYGAAMPAALSAMYAVPH